MPRPQQFRPSCCVLTRKESMRVDAFICRVGRTRARELLGIGAFTLDAAREDGARMLIKTRDRLLSALDAVEAT